MWPSLLYPYRYLPHWFSCNVLRGRLLYYSFLTFSFPDVVLVRETHGHDVTVMGDRIALAPAVRLNAKPGISAEDPGLFTMALDLTESLASND